MNRQSPSISPVPVYSLNKCLTDILNMLYMMHAMENLTNAYKDVSATVLTRLALIVVLSSTGCASPAENDRLPSVVRGVPVRIERHRIDQHCEHDYLHTPDPEAKCIGKQVLGYYLEVKQCIADVDKVRQSKEPAPPFDASKGCYTQEIQVTQQIFQALSDGEAAVFPGSAETPVIPPTP